MEHAQRGKQRPIGAGREMSAGCLCLVAGTLGIRLADGGDQNAAALQHRPRSRLCFAADEVEHQVDLGDLLRKILRAVVDELRRTEALHVLPIASRSGADDVRAGQFRQLHCRTPHAARRGMD